jgi:outer membrane murein-binding lipoprotein Lpp
MTTLVTARQSGPLKSRIVFYLVVLAGSLLPGAVAAQRSGDTAQFEARFNMLQRSLADLSAQIEQLNAGSDQLQQQLDRMRANYDQRLQRLERGPVPQATPALPGRSKP